MKRDRSQWRTSVLKDPKLPDSTRVLLLHIADNYMSRQDRKFSVPRKHLAEDLNRHERRITERMTDAHKKGYLVTVSPGYIGHTAVYQGTWPDWSCGTDRSPHERETDSRPHAHAQEGDGFPPTTTRANLTVVGSSRDKRSDDERRSPRCRFHLTGVAA